MKCLVVIAHPLEDSLCQYLATKTVDHLEEKGYQVSVKDLYKINFDPVLSVQERLSYHEAKFDDTQLTADIEQLKQAQSIVLVFPTWWFGFPAILKGWFDRTWAPGHTYEHASENQPMKPSLHNLKEVKVITTLSAPWWVDKLILRQPVKKVLKMAILGGCAKNAKLTMLSLYNSQATTPQKVDKFVHKIRTIF